jgi:hypothetical protein
MLRESSGVRKRVEHAEAAIRQQQEDTLGAENTGGTTTEPKTKFHEIIVAIGQSLSNIASFDNRENWEDEDDEETQQGQQSETDDPGWVMSTITKTVKQQMEKLRQKQIKLDELIQLRCEDAPNYYR